MDEKQITMLRVRLSISDLSLLLCCLNGLCLLMARNKRDRHSLAFLGVPRALAREKIWQWRER